MADFNRVWSISFFSISIAFRNSLFFLKEWTRSLISGIGDEEGVKRSKARLEKERENLQKAEKAEARYSVDLDDAAEEFLDLEIRAAGLDPDELMEARLALVEQWIFLDLMWSNWEIIPIWCFNHLLLQ